MLCFLYNLPIVTLVLWVLSLQMSCAPILILLPKGNFKKTLAWSTAIICKAMLFLKVILAL